MDMIKIIPIMTASVREGQINRFASYVIHVEQDGYAFDIQIKQDPKIENSILFFEPCYEQSNQDLIQLINDLIEIEQLTYTKEQI